MDDRVPVAPDTAGRAPKRPVTLRTPEAMAVRAVSSAVPATAVARRSGRPAAFVATLPTASRPAPKARAVPATAVVRRGEEASASSATSADCSFTVRTRRELTKLRLASASRAAASAAW